MSLASDFTTRPGFTLLWQCFGESFDRLQSIAKTHDPLKYICCTEIEATGFLKVALNGFYIFTGNLINGRHLYVEKDNVYGIWFNGAYGAAADWVVGWMSDLAEGRDTYGWALSNQDTSCPSLTKEWDQWWSNQWLNSKTDNVKCIV